MITDTVFSRAYWIEARKDAPGKKRAVISIDFESMTKSTFLIDTYQGIFDSLKRAVALNRVTYSSPEAYYLIQQVYELA